MESMGGPTPTGASRDGCYHRRMPGRPNDEETPPVSETNLDASSPTTPFSQRVYEVVARIPYGRVTTYGAIAHALGVPRAAREVGWALNVTPASADLPCHRVV